jgi:hypothetical protein
MTRERNFNVETLDRAANLGTVIHVRFAGRSFDIPLVGLDLSSESGDVEVKHVIAGHLEVADRRLDDYVVDRHVNGNLTLRPAAVFG